MRIESQNEYDKSSQQREDEGWFRQLNEMESRELQEQTAFYSKKAEHHLGIIRKYVTWAFWLVLISTLFGFFIQLGLMAIFR